MTKQKSISACLVLALVCAAAVAHAGVGGIEPERFAPQDLQQDGRITLSPGFSPDGQTIYFAQSECRSIGRCPQRLKSSRRTATGWSEPQLVPLPVDARVDWPSVTPDGKRLLFSWSAPQARYAGLDIGEDFDLYELDLTTDNAVPRALTCCNINRPRAGAIKSLRYVHNETAPTLTRDGDLYFWTERFDAVGERDIFVAPADGAGSFRTARPLAAPINSRQREDHVWVAPEGNLMLLTSSARGGLGGEELFVSRKCGVQWQVPLSLGAPVNSPYNDLAARLSPDGNQLVFTSDRPVEGRAPGLPQVWTMEAASVEALRSLPDCD